MIAQPRIYLDYNATAPLRPEARAALIAALEATGNASSVHKEGRDARARIEQARTSIAALVGGTAKGIVFTSGATEANVTALTPNWISGGRDVRIGRLLVGAVEHPSVLRGGQFPPGSADVIAVDGDGRLRLDCLADRVADSRDRGEVPLLALQLANNETGVIQPVAEAARLVRAAGGVIHCDAVQAAGRLPVALDGLDVDTLSVSAHKLGGPQGVGALVLRAGRAHPAPLMVGGGQEGWRRAGTEPVAAIHAFGRAAEAARAELSAMPLVAARRDRLQAALRAATPEARIFAEQAERLPNTLALAVPGMAAETAVIAFDLAGVALSSGSACSSGKVATSHVLQAMGVEPGLARGGLRISIGAATTDAEIDRLIGIWRTVTGQLLHARLRATA